MAWSVNMPGIYVYNALRAPREPIDTATRTRFIDRSGFSPSQLVAAAAKISSDLGAVVQQIAFPKI
jgi:hypothetical protein